LAPADRIVDGVVPGLRAHGDMTANQRIHRYLTWQHRWAGLLMAVFLAVVGITGSLLVYTPEIERAINPQFFAKPRPGAQQLSL
jgi:uncharacterized iron-regulated membrane protein